MDMYEEPSHSVDDVEVFIKTDQEVYSPGNTIYGKIFIKAKKTIDADKLLIQVRGEEKAHGTEGFGEDEVDIKYTREIFNFLGEAYTFEQPMDSGDFYIGF